MLQYCIRLSRVKKIAVLFNENSERGTGNPHGWHQEVQVLLLESKVSKLAGLHFNENSEQEQATAKDGTAKSSPTRTQSFMSFSSQNLLSYTSTVNRNRQPPWMAPKGSNSADSKIKKPQAGGQKLHKTLQEMEAKRPSMMLDMYTKQLVCTWE